MHCRGTLPDGRRDAEPGTPTHQISLKDVQMSDNTVTHPRAGGAVSTRITASALVLTLATTACSNDRPTEPTSELTPAAAPIMTAAGRLAAGTLLDDASTRLMPSLGDAIAQAELRGHLDDLSAALQANDAAKARRRIALARKTIAALADSPDAADLAVLRISLDQVEAQLDGAVAPIDPPKE